MPLVDPREVTDAEREAVTRLVAGEPDADRILELLFAQPGPSSAERTANYQRRLPPSVTPAERERVRWMRSKGMTLQAIADGLGRSRHTVSVIVKEQEA